MRTLPYLLLFLFFISLTACSQQNETPKELQETIHTLWQKSNRFEANTQIKEALICYWRAIDLLDCEQDTVLKAQTYNRLGDLLFRYGLYEKAVENHRESYQLAQRTTDKQLLYEATRKLTLDYTLLHQPDTATYFRELSNRLAQKHRLKEVLFPDEKNLRSETSGARTDSILNLYEKEQLLAWEARYKEEKARLQAEQDYSRKLRQGCLFCTVTSLLLLLLLITYWRKKKEEQRQEAQWRWFNHLLDNTRKELENSQSELFASRSHIHELQQMLKENQYSRQENKTLREELNFLLSQEETIRNKEQQLRLQEQALLSEQSLHAVTLLNRMKSRPVYQPVQNAEEWKILQDFTCLLYPDYKEQMLHAETLTERDIELACLIRLGFSTGQLAVFYGISPGSITKAKFRLQKKLGITETPTKTVQYQSA